MTTSMRGVLVPLVLALACGGAESPYLQEGPQSAVQSLNQTPTPYSFEQHCQQPYSQVCNPMWTQSVITRGGPLSVSYVAAGTHCSNVYVDVYLDGVLKQTTGILRPLENSGWLDLGNVNNGAHTIGLMARGVTGGCNVGALSSWGGTLSMKPVVLYPFAQRCQQPYSQVCNPMWTQDVTTDTGGPLSVSYTAAGTHCSDVYVDVYLDGVLKKTTDILHPLENSGWLDLGNVPRGSHTIGLMAHGVTGGCNVGALGSWGGILSVDTH